MTSKQVLGIGLTLLAGGLGALALRAMVAPTNAGPKASVAPVDLPYSKPAKAVLPYSPSPNSGSKGLSLGNIMWHMENLNSVATAVIDSITIESANDYPTRDIKVACMTRGASGTPISTVERTIYNIVPAKGTATFRNVVLGPINSQSDSMECLLD